MPLRFGYTRLIIPPRISVPTQALLDVSSSLNPALSYGAEGLLGLGFTSLSTIDHVVNATGSSMGRSLLYNLFQDNPSEPNFIAFSLQRSSEADSTVQGTFTIGKISNIKHHSSCYTNFRAQANTILNMLRWLITNPFQLGLWTHLNAGMFFLMPFFLVVRQ